MTDLLINTVEIIHREVLEQMQRNNEILGEVYGLETRIDYLSDNISRLIDQVKDIYGMIIGLKARIDDLEASLDAQQALIKSIQTTKITIEEV